MSADSPRQTSGTRGIAVPAIVPPQVVIDRSVLDSAIGFINDVTLVHQPITDPKDTITWARFETAADVSDPRFGDDWEIEGNAAPPLLLILGYGLGVQVWAIPANGEAVEVLSWRHGIVSALRILPTPVTAAALDDNGRAGEPRDLFVEKRPLIAFVDGGTGAMATGGNMSTLGGSQQFCAVNFSSLKTGAQVKTIKFKNPVLDIQANRSAIIITFNERIAVFDARTLEDRLTITTCYPSPGINPNPVALGSRWLAYAEQKLVHPRRSGGGCDGEGVSSYTATVLNAAKSLGKGLRELGEQMAAGLTGTAGSTSSSKNNSFDSASGSDVKQAGVVTIIDIKHPIKDYSPTSGIAVNLNANFDPIVAHFVAHTEAIVAMEFDSSGMLLLTADRRGHDFHVFRVQPHPVGSNLAAVHHLYVLHRGDTSAKVQNIAFSHDSRWVAVSTLRGTTHVFPITPYGGAMGVRTHTSLHVVNKLSRFHRSAGLTADGRSSSPISHSESTMFTQSLQPYHNPTLPPFPRPAVVQPLAQLRQPFAIGSPPGSASLAAVSGKLGGVTGGSSASASTSQRQRLSSLSDDSGKPLSVCSIFAKSRSWLLDPPNSTREASHRIQHKAVDSLFVMAGHGALIQYDLDTKLASNVAKEKICDDTPIELEVEAKAQWNLGRRKDGSQEVIPPLALDSWLIKDRHACTLLDKAHQDDTDDQVESWLSQVEIITHAGPHRRLWMGPQFVFKNYNTPSGSNLNHVDVEAIEIGVSKNVSASGINIMPSAGVASVGISVSNCSGRSSPLNMPNTPTGRSGVPVLIESGSYSSIEQSPKLMDHFQHGHLDSDFGHGDTRLKEDLADAMRESPSITAARRESSRLLLGSENVQSSAAHITAAARIENLYYYDALNKYHDDDGGLDLAYAVGVGSDELSENIGSEKQRRLGKAFKSNVAMSSASAAALATVLPNICSYEQGANVTTIIEKIVNPLGTVTTISPGSTTIANTDILDEVVSQLATEDYVIHENCDEALFRPVFTIFCNDKCNKDGCKDNNSTSEECCKPPVAITNKLIVPVIAMEVNEVLTKKEKHQKIHVKTKQLRQYEYFNCNQVDDQQQKQQFVEHSTLSRHCNDISEVVDPIISATMNRMQDSKTRKNSEKYEREPENPSVELKCGTSESQENINKSKQKQHCCTEENQKKECRAKDLGNPSDKLENAVANEKASRKEEKMTTQANAVTVVDMATTSQKIKPKAITIGGKKNTNKYTKVVGPKKKETAKVFKEIKHGKPSNELSVDLGTASLTISLPNKTGEGEPPTAVVQLASPVEIYANKTPPANPSDCKREGKYSSPETDFHLEVKKPYGMLYNLDDKEVEPQAESTLEVCQPTDNLANTNIKYFSKALRKPDEEVKDSREAKNTTPEIKESLSVTNISNKSAGIVANYEIDEGKTFVPKQTTAAKNCINSNEKADEQSITGKIRMPTSEQSATPKSNLVKVTDDFLLSVAYNSDNENESTEIDACKKSSKAARMPMAGLIKKLIKTPAQTEKSSKIKTSNQENWRDAQEYDHMEQKTVAHNQKLTISNAWNVPNRVEPLNNTVGAITSTASTTTETNKIDFPNLSNSTQKSVKLSSTESIRGKREEPVRHDGSQIPTKSSLKLSSQSVLFKKPLAMSEVDKTSGSSANVMDFNEYLLLKPLESLSPLPKLEPLEIISKAKDSLVTNQTSLINFDSPHKESEALLRKITPPRRDFNEQNLIFALCGSLHYENEFAASEQTAIIETDGKMDPLSPSLPVTAGGKSCGTSLKSTSSSNISSCSDEIIIVEEQQHKSKKHKRSKQQSERLQKKCVEHVVPQDDDDELCPLINMSDSQLDSLCGESSTQLTSVSKEDLLIGKQLSELAFTKNNSGANMTSLAQSTPTTTDSDGTLPATTSDDNLYMLAPSVMHATPHKLKTKKLDHKINLIAAIEAATSSSTSSAEESSVEIGRPTCGSAAGASLGSENANPCDYVTASSNSAAITVSKSSPMSTALSSSDCANAAAPANTAVITNAQQNVPKKKTKRRKR